MGGPSGTIYKTVNNESIIDLSINLFDFQGFTKILEWIIDIPSFDLLTLITYKYLIYNRSQVNEIRFSL